MTHCLLLNKTKLKYEVNRNRYVKHQVTKVDSRAILLLIATSVGALMLFIIKQTNTNITNQPNKLIK